MLEDWPGRGNPPADGDRDGVTDLRVDAGRPHKDEREIVVGDLVSLRLDELEIDGDKPIRRLARRSPHQLG